MRTKLQSCGQILLIPLRSIRENPLRARIYYNDAHTDELVRSIAASGIVEPLTVCKGAGGKYVIISGQRRYRAAKELGFSMVPCVLIESDAENALFTGFSNQLAHDPLNFFEVAVSCEKLRDAFGLTYEETAARVGMPLPELLNKVRLLQIPAKYRKAIVEHALGESYARLLLRHPDEQKGELLERILREHLSLREARAASDALLRPVRPAPARIQTRFRDATVFVNTIDRACRAMKSAGVPADVRKTEGPAGIRYEIEIALSIER